MDRNEIEKRLLELEPSALLVTRDSDFPDNHLLAQKLDVGGTPVRYAVTRSGNAGTVIEYFVP